MITIPLMLPDNTMDLIFVVTGENLDRLQKYDPMSFEVLKLGHPWNTYRIRRIVVCYATLEEVRELEACETREQVLAMVQKLHRGWKYLPEQGDHDRPYMPNRIDRN